MPDERFFQRTLTEQDAEAYVALIDAVSDADGDPYRLDEAGYLSLLRSPLATPELAHLTGLFDGGLLVAAGAVARRPSADPVHWMSAAGAVRPGYRGLGLGTALLRWQQALAPRIHERHFPGRPSELSVYALGGNAAARELFENEGFAPLRWYFDMSMPEDARPGEDRAPEGLVFAPFTEADGEQVRQAHNEVFVEHFRFTPWRPQDWDHWIGQDKIRRDLSFLLRDARTGELAGYLVASFLAAEFAATGVRDVHFNLIGTRNAYRRRGVASALIAHAVHAARGLGFQTASLGVDAQNPTGALGVYERAGFVCTHERVGYNKVLSATGV